jgi:integrase
MSIIRIKRKKGFVYRVKVWRDGKRYSKTFDRSEDAKEFHREIRLAGGELDLGYTFSQAADEWIGNHAEVRKAPSSVRTDRQMLRDDILPQVGAMPLRDIAPKHIETMIGRLLGQGMSHSSVNRRLELLRAIFYYAMKRRRAIFNPVKVVGLLKVQQPPFDYWERHEASQFLEYISRKYEGRASDLSFLFKFAMNTGMRLGEILGLGWSDVDLGNKLIAVRRTYDSYQHKIKETTKGRKLRHVPINSAIYDDLVEMKAQRDGELVFSTITGNPKDRSNVTHYFHRDSREAGVRRIRFHDLRHTYASHFMMNGGDIFHLKEILGHSDIKTTMRYAHLSKTFLIDKADTVCFTADKNVIRVKFRKNAMNA